MEVCQDLLHLHFVLSFVRDCKGLELNKIKVAACTVPLYIYIYSTCTSTSNTCNGVKPMWPRGVIPGLTGLP